MQPPSICAAKCPLPARRARKALSRLQGGATLVIECTDPLAEIGIPNLVRETGDALEDKARHGDVMVFASASGAAEIHFGFGAQRNARKNSKCRSGVGGANAA